MTAVPVRDPDRRLLRRATIAVTGQLAVAVAVTIVVVSALAFSFTILAEHASEERTVREVTLQAGADLSGTDGVVLLRRSPDGVVTAGPGVPIGLRDLDLTALPKGRGNARLQDRHFEVYVVESPDGTRLAGLLDVTDRTEASEHLVESILVAALIGIALAALIGTILGRRAVRPLATALSIQRRFVADASHELRTPLTVLHTRAELIRRRLARSGPGDARLAADVDQLAADTLALDEVIEDLLLSAELQHRRSGGEPVDTAVVVRELVASLYPYAQERGVALRTDLDGADVTVTGVRSSLRRALSALVDNALAHTGPGGTVVVGAYREGGTVVLSVADDGEGLDPADAQRLLMRFARGEPGRDGSGRRFGLGLALVREVVDAHSGRMLVDGAPGRGARFTIVLPAT